MPRLIERLKGQNAVIARSVFSHFVGSDSPKFDDFTRQQFEMFDLASLTLQAAFHHKIIRHICNSAAIERFPEKQLDMVRLGIGLYGVSPIDNTIINNVSTLRTTILQVRDVPAEDTVGYSRKGLLKRPSRIAAIPIGYADGLNRHLGNGHVRTYLIARRKKRFSMTVNVISSIFVLLCRILFQCPVMILIKRMPCSNPHIFAKL